jgi:hypothetical protein
MKGKLHEFLNAVKLSACDDEILGRMVLERAPHRIDVIAGKAPIYERIEVADRQGISFARGDLCDTLRDARCNEPWSSAWGLVIV